MAIRTESVGSSGDGAEVFITFDDVTNQIISYRANNRRGTFLDIEITNTVTRQSSSRRVEANRDQQAVNIASLGIKVSEGTGYQVVCRWQ